MKNTDPPDSTTKAVKITPELSKFIEGMGVYFENQGVPRIGGRILALLMISHNPLSPEEIGSILKISRGSISTNMRILTAGGLAEKVTIPGNRTARFEFPATGFEQMIVTRIRTSQVFKKLVEQGLRAVPTENFARHRLESAKEWTDLLIDNFQKVIDDGQALRQSEIEKNSKNKPSKIIDASFRVAKTLPQKN